LTEHQLFLFLVEALLIVVVARAGGELALRIGVPQVIGELVFGIALGPSLFGALWPGGFAAVFPADLAQRNLLEVIGWIGVVFLVMLSGWETRLGVLRRSGGAVAWGWVGGFLLPFTMGFGLGLLVPRELTGVGVSKPIFALFLGTAMSISAIPVIARILIDLEMLSSKVGMVILSTAVADDTVGWIVLALVTGFATTKGFDGPTVLTALVGTAIFLTVAFTVGQWAVRHAIRFAGRRLRAPYARTTMMIAIVLAGAAITQAFHVHLVLGAFVGAILVTRSRGKYEPGIEALRHVGMAFFIPFFFGYTGIKVDLTTLTGAAIPVAIAAVSVACVGKLVGGSVGSRLGGLSWPEAWAVGAGLNARGAMELVIAAIGLSIGVLTLPMYSIVVLIAVVTTLMAGPMLRRYKIHHLTEATIPPLDRSEVSA
jgi:Kef-type K+ transport system membrane component KefB